MDGDGTLRAAVLTEVAMCRSDGSRGGRVEALSALGIGDKQSCCELF